MATTSSFLSYCAASLCVGLLLDPAIAGAANCIDSSSQNACDTDSSDGSTAEDICTATSTTITCDLGRISHTYGAVDVYAILNTNTDEYNIFGYEGSGSLFCCSFSAADRTTLNLYGTNQGDDIDLTYTSDSGTTWYQLEPHDENFVGEVFGRSGADTIVGSTSEGGTYTYQDRLHGDGDGDTIYGQQGNDIITGDAGVDELFGEAGSDTVEGGSDNDYVYGDDGEGGTDSADTLYGNDGIDYVYGGAGGDSISGGNGNDRLHGQADNDTVYGEEDNDQITGGAGSDHLYGGNDPDYINGGEGEDFLYGDDDVDKLCGDDASGSSSADELYGGAGDDRGWGPGATCDTNEDSGDGGTHGTEDLYDQCSWGNYINVETILSSRPSDCPTTE